MNRVAGSTCTLEGGESPAAILTRTVILYAEPSIDSRLDNPEPMISQHPIRQFYGFPDGIAPSLSSSPSAILFSVVSRHRMLRQHVETDRLLGVTSLPLGETPSRNEEQASPSVPNRETKLRILCALNEDEVVGCTKCDLHRERTNTVFGEGDVDASIMFVGEGPGQNEDEQGRPFVGRAGDLLNKQIEAMGFTREQVYIANIVKCRPPNNRTPTPDEVSCCAEYLQRQIATLRPQVIIALGSPAAKFLLDTKQGITSLRGTWHTYNGLLPDGPPIDVMPTFHPAYLLRAYTTDNRKKVWSDLQAALERVGRN